MEDASTPGRVLLRVHGADLPAELYLDDLLHPRAITPIAAASAPLTASQPTTSSATLEVTGNGAGGRGGKSRGRKGGRVLGVASLVRKNPQPDGGGGDDQGGNERHNQDD